MSSSTMQKSLVDALTQRFEKQESCDVIFFVEDKQIGAHKMVVEAQCKVLHDMIKDCTQDQKPFPVEDINYKTFEAVLRFLYCGEIAVSGENVFDFLSASVQFKMDCLEKMCVDHIAKLMGKYNVCDYMNKAMLFGSKHLQKKCLKMFEKQTSGVIMTRSFDELSQPALSAFLDAEKITVLEITIFYFVKQWMEWECYNQGLEVTGENMREVLGDAIFKIRFPTMTVQDFANTVTTIDGFLSDTEKSQIFQKITLFDSKNMECPFSNIFRCQKSYFYVPMQDMQCLLQHKGIYRSGERQSFNARSLVDHIKNLEDSNEMFPDSFHLLAQCCADMANTSRLANARPQENAASRQELSKKLQKWEAACNSEEQNVSEIMTSFMDFRKELDKSTKWSI